MDPKQTEGQNTTGPAMPQGGFSFQTGQMNSAPGATPSAAGSNSSVAGATPNADQTGTLSTGANIARTMKDLNMGDRKSATSNSPFAKHHFNKVAPQTGDIIIEQSDNKSNGLFFKKVKNPTGSVVSDSNTGGKFNRGRMIQFGLILGGIALVGLVIFTVVTLITQPKKSSSNDDASDTVATGNPEELFSNYMNFLAFGPDGDSVQRDDEQTMLVYSVDPYAVAEIDKPDSESRTEYIEELNRKWNSFASAYSGDFVSANRLADVSLYFYDFAKIAILNEEDLYDIYISTGKNLESAKQQVLEKIYSSSTHPSIEYFVKIRQDYALATLDLLSEEERANCLSEESLPEQCTINNSDVLTKYNEAVAALDSETSIKKKDTLLSNALIPLADLEEEFYGDSDEDSVSIVNWSRS